MGSKSFVVLFLASGTLFLVNGQLSDECPKIPLITDFDLEKAMGDWYPQMMAFENETVKTCLHYNLKADKNKPNVTITVQRFWDNKSDFFKMVSNKGTSRFEIDWLGHHRVMWLVATNYKSWGVWYSCFMENPKKSVLIYSTKVAKGNPADVKKAEEAVKSIDFGGLREYIKPINRDGCK